MNKEVLIAGGGIGGLAGALACSRAGCLVRLYERASEFSEVGAGIQIGPNVVRVLHDWGLASGLESVAAFPERLRVRSALAGNDLGALRLGAAMHRRYGAPYATIHRADLHQLLLTALQGRDNVWLRTNHEVERFEQTSEAVRLRFSQGLEVEGDALIGADGLWSRVRAQLLGDGPPRVSGHLAWRAMLRQSDLPAAMRTQEVTLWLGPEMHVVHYPVRRGEWLNVVAIVHGHVQGSLEDWDHGADAAELQGRMSRACAELRERIAAVPSWRLWVLCDREPMRGPDEQARGRVALLGDSAHPMRPYLAQGAGMAIEDAACLGRLLEQGHGLAGAPVLLHRYALNRWQRNAQVQARAIRNGEVFHLRGLAARARDAALSALGERLLDQPWLYRGA